ncbi:MAG: hypothetical protein AAF218_06970 [Pseudomonadota bacterium]
MDFASLLLSFLTLWLWAGAAVALVFLTWGIDRIDEDAQGAYVFRLLLIPGILLLWPLVLRRWWQLEAAASPWLRRHRPVRRAHRLAAPLMCAAMAALLVLGLSARQDWPAGIAPVQVSEAAE